MNYTAKTIPPFFRNMKGCTELLKVPGVLLTWAKKEGCQAFRKDGKIETLVLLQFLFDRQDDEDAGVDESKELTKWRKEREKLKFQKEKRLILDKQEAAADCIKATLALFSAMDRAITVELAADLRGRESHEIEKALMEMKERLKKDWDKNLAALSGKRKEENKYL